MNNIILENLIRQISNKGQIKTLAIAIWNNLKSEERQKLFEELTKIKNDNDIFLNNFKLS